MVQNTGVSPTTPVDPVEPTIGTTTVNPSTGESLIPGTGTPGSTAMITNGTCAPSPIGADGMFMNLRMPFVGYRHVEVVRAARCGRTVRTRYALVVRDGLVGRDDENGGDDDGCDTNASEM